MFMMHSRYMMLIVVILFSFTINCFAQTESIHGLWLMEHVQVGDQEMTPVARWTKIQPDGTYESGNGWLKSSEGIWALNKAEKTFLPKETNGLIDPFGAFTVQFIENGMTWTRYEDGMEVVVTLKPIHELPKAPADSVQGVWDLVEATNGEASILNHIDPMNAHYLFLRWDRIYVARDAEGNRETGYWHMNGHRPEMTLISHSNGNEPQSWQVSINEKYNMILSGYSESNRGQTLTYIRLNQFPD